MIAIIEAYQAGLLTPKYWLRNIIAGLIVGIVALPLAMAFAIASGVPPQQGLYTAIVAGCMVGLFGGSRVQIAGPTGAFIVILAGITGKYGIEGLQIATLLAGFILLFMGIIKLGNIIKFIPNPVIVGFTSGIGVIIFVSEWKDFFGLTPHLPLDAAFHSKLFALIKALPQWDPPTTVLACLSLFLVVLTPKYLKRIPGPLVAMLVATLLQWQFQFKTVATIGSAFGGIPSILPVLHFPTIGAKQIVNLLGPAFTIALLGAIESLLSASAADGMAKTRHQSNQELIGQGLANIIAPIFGGFAATGAIARTATNIRNGGNSPISAIVHSIFLLLVIVILSPLAIHVPLCTLAAILFVVAYNMSDVKHFIYTLFHAPRHDILILSSTFILTIFSNLVVAVNVGVILAMLLFIRRMNQFVQVDKEDNAAINNEIFIYSIQGPFFFAVAEKIERALVTAQPDPKMIIFRLKNVPFIDMTGLQTLRQIIEEFNTRGVKVYLCEANTKVSRKLENTGFNRLVTDGRIFATISDIFHSLPFLNAY